MNSPLVVIVGPTAGGKSALGMEVARRCDGEIICADSRTVYKGMDIGTAKPTEVDRSEIPHHLLDVVEPGEPFTAADFKRLALEAITDIAARGKIPILVGGTGLYIDAVIFDYHFGEPADPNRRTELLGRTTEELVALCEELGIELPVNATNRRHLIRAIELGGLVKQPKMLRPNTIVVGIAPEKEVLRRRIELRASEMLREGVQEEVKKLARQYGWDSEAMTGNIYRLFRGVIDGSKSLTEALEDSIRSDMALAKRQMTWFKRNPWISWSNEPRELLIKVEQFLSRQAK